ncbi:MAG: phosphatidylglycerol:prolipoprotein diacylglycerol transferase [Myxococcota bacterium]|jgi:phosphatidylglycerol:prolipoprotein diacylglycerol transferase
MYPILFTIPGIDYPISSFGVMMAMGFLAAYWLTARELPSKGIDPELSSNLLLFVMIGGVLGAKLYFATDMVFREGDSFSSYFFRRDGITWYGGLLGGMAAAAAASRFYGLEMRRLFEAGAVATAIGQCFGRVGCFLVGDDYGIASDLPWAVAFPIGAPPINIPVHPTQLYEVVWLLPIAWLLYSRRAISPFLFGEYMIANGLGRLVIESLRRNPKVALGLTEPQWIGIGLIVAGIASWIYFRNKDRKLAAA